jgi:hypothetical protein
MFGSSSFGALGVDESSAAGPSTRVLEGEEVDVDVSAGTPSILRLSVTVLANVFDRVVTDPSVAPFGQDQP